MTILEAITRMEAGTLTALELVNTCLQTIEERDGVIGAFLEVYTDEARVRASAIDARRAAGETLGQLAGIPISIKDNFLFEGHTVTAGSQILDGHVASYSATVIQRLLDADAIIIGRTNMDEFACGSSTEHSAYQKTTNPHDHTRVPGGSSGGSAASVAAGMCLASLGTDTGGSIRQPASFCGVVGVKPTYGRNSRFGVIAMASSLDQVGVFGTTVDCTARVQAVIEGYDSFDATSLHRPAKAPATSVQGLRVGVPKEYFIDGMDTHIATGVREAIQSLKDRGADIIEISLPHTVHALATYYVIMPCELSSNLARYDGMRYGLSIGSTLGERYDATRDAGFGDEIKRRVMLGTFALSAGYYDAFYHKAIAMRDTITAEFSDSFMNVDVIISPTTPSAAFPLGEKVSDPLAMYLADIYTVSANLSGIPAISVPCGMSEGLPFGIQVMAPHMREDVMFHVATLLEVS